MEKSVSVAVCRIAFAVVLFAAPGSAAAQGDADIEAKFIAMLKNATLKGSWAPVQQGRLGSESGDDGYRIARVGEGRRRQMVDRFDIHRAGSASGVPDLRFRKVRGRHSGAHSGQRPRRTRAKPTGRPASCSTTTSTPAAGGKRPTANTAARSPAPSRGRRSLRRERQVEFLPSALSPSRRVNEPRRSGVANDHGSGCDPRIVRRGPRPRVTEESA